MIKYLQAYRRASGSVKTFIWTVILLMGVIVVTTVWAYARLSYARTNILQAHPEPERTKSSTHDQ